MAKSIFILILAARNILLSDATKLWGNADGCAQSSCFISPALATNGKIKHERIIEPWERHNVQFLKSYSPPLGSASSNLEKTIQVDTKSYKRKSHQRRNKRIHNSQSHLVHDSDEILEELDSMNLMNITAVMNDLSRSRARESAEKLELILRSLQTQGKNGGFRPNVVHYALPINGWANNGDTARAESILYEMIENISQKDAVIPNSHCFSCVMKAYVRWGKNIKNTNESNRPTYKCEELFEKMLQLYQQTGDEVLKPNVIIFNTLLDAYAKEAAREATKQSSNVIRYRRRMKQQSTLLQTEFVTKAKELFQRMQEGYYNVYPDKYSYCSVISALAKCGDAQSAELAESYLLQMMNVTELQPDLPTYNAVLSAWASIGSTDGARRAESLLDRMENQTSFVEDPTVNKSNSNRSTSPNAVSYNTVISAWIKSCTECDNGYAALQAESILRRMEKTHQKIVKNNGYKNSKTKYFQPNVISYSSIIDCWSKSGSPEAGVRAQALLDRMEMLSESGSNIQVTPNVVTFSSVLSSYGRSGLSDSAKKANDLLMRMKLLHKTGKNPKAKPNVVSYFAVIDSWARSNNTDAGFNALALLKEIENLSLAGNSDVTPNIRCYSRVLVALANSRKKRSDRSAEQLLTNMEEFARTGDKRFAQQKPNVVCYNTLISSYAKRGKASRAIAILNKMDQYSSISRNEKDKIRPDAHTLNSIIYSLSVSKEIHKARRSLKILQRLEKSHVSGDWRATPSNQSYNMVINACSTTHGTDDKRAEAMQVALDAFSRLQSSKYAKPDRYTYISLLKTCGRQLSIDSSDRTRIVENVFSYCCEDGIVDDSVLQNFILAAPMDLKYKMSSSACLAFDDKKMSYQNLTAAILPEYWTRNVILSRKC